MMVEDWGVASKPPGDVLVGNNEASKAQSGWKYEAKVDQLA